MFESYADGLPRAAAEVIEDEDAGGHGAVGDAGSGEQAEPDEYSETAHHAMRDQDTPELPMPSREAEEATRRADTRRAIVFGVVMATIQMGILLYFLYS